MLSTTVMPFQAQKYLKPTQLLREKKTTQLLKICSVSNTNMSSFYRYNNATYDMITEIIIALQFKPPLTWGKPCNNDESGFFYSLLISSLIDIN